MAANLKELGVIARDGTSQAARFLEALDPGYAPVDERTVEDLLAFARQLGAEIPYYDADDEEDGDWNGFVDPRLRLEDVAAFMAAPEKFPADEHPLLHRPHFVLFLTFLELLRRAQGELNGLTRRHLDFYYRQVLRMRGKPAIPDRVNLLFELRSGVDQAMVPAGTLLDAGPDSLGRQRIYATDRDLLVNRAQVAKLRSLALEQRVTGIREARESYRNEKAAGAVAMFEIALGDPLPGDPLPPYAGGVTVDYAFLLDRFALVRFAQTDLYMPIFDLRRMMELKLRRDGADAEWAEINALLEKAGQNRDPAFTLSPADPRDFDANLTAAAGAVPNYDGLPEIENVDDLYYHRTRQDAQDFIRDRLCFAELGDFVRMMQIKVRIDAEWDEVNRILETAGRRKDPSFRFAAGFDPTAFDANLTAAVGPVDFSSLTGVADLDAYYAALRVVEAYFFMLAAEFAYVMEVADKGMAVATPAEWAKVDPILTAAHRAKVYAGRRRRLREIRAADGFTAMIRHALGEEPAEGEDPAVLDRLRPYLGNDAEYELLQQAATGAEADQDWDRVYEVVEVAQRNREALPAPVPRKVEWLNLHPAADATAVTDAPDRFKTFGVPADPDPAAENEPPPVIGWGVRSPQLALSTGRREITLTLGFDPDGYDAALLRPLVEGERLIQDGPFRFEVTTVKGWVEPAAGVGALGGYETLTATSGAGHQDLVALQFRLTFPADVDPIVPAPGEPWPTLRLMLRQLMDERTARYVTHYPPFRHLRLAAVHLRVAVSGLAGVRIRNDHRTLDANKPFEPFGTSPAAGSRLVVGHPELVTKHLDRLTFHVEWMGLPDDLTAHYRNYGLATTNFTTRVSLVDRRVETELAGAAPLFSPANAIEITAAGPERSLVDSFPDELLSWDRYLQWEINAPDLQHGRYPVVAAEKATAMAAAMAAGQTINAADYQVNPPYTPKLKSLRVDYTSTLELDLGRARSGDPVDGVCHYRPFGWSDVEAERGAGQLPPLLPPYENQGALYLGLRDARPPQTVSLLFQMAEGSADPDLEREPIRWSYLSGDRWLTLDDGNVVVDTTRGLVNSGLIAIALEPATASTRVAGDFYWLRATIARNPGSVCDAVAVHSQAVAATFVDRANASDHFARPLPAETITRLVGTRPEIAAVRQPYTSWGGRMAEEAELFNTRVSERLRHKGRALTTWDYEHLVLERFPEIYKVKCIPAQLAGTFDPPGTVAVVVIPDVRNRLPFDPFAAKAPADLLAEISEFLVARTSGAVALTVTNAHFVAVMVHVAVRFRAGANEGYHRKLLQDELIRYLSPWAWDEGAEIVVGGKIYANSIVDFLDRRPYVDYVVDLRLYSSDDGTSFVAAAPAGEGGYFVAGERPDAVLVAARQHRINVIPEAGYEAKLMTGINYMTMELDFNVI